MHLVECLNNRLVRTLSYDDVTHYGKIVVALKETMRLMRQINEVIPLWPIERLCLRRACEGSPTRHR